MSRATACERMTTHRDHQGRRRAFGLRGRLGAGGGVRSGEAGSLRCSGPSRELSTAESVDCAV